MLKLIFKMKKYIGHFLFIFSLLLVFSCEPNRAEDGDLLFGVQNPGETGGNGGGTGVVKNLKSVTAIDDVGETLTFNYIYQAGKLTSVTTSDNSVSYTLSYQNNLINHIKVVQDDGSLITTTDFAISYNNGKFVEAKGAGAESDGTTFNNTLTATYSNNKISKILSKMVGYDITDPTITYDMFTLQSDITYTGNNISTWKFTTTFPLTPPINFPPIILNATFSNYDTKINPFNTLPEAYNIISSLYGTDSTAVTGFSANNYGKLAIENQSATYIYTYDADGYPTKAVASNNLGTITFVYQ